MLWHPNRQVFLVFYRLISNICVCLPLKSKLFHLVLTHVAILGKLDDSDAKAFRDFLIIRGWEKGKIFFLLDNFFGKVKKYYSFEELKILLQKTGFKKIRHLTKDIEPNGTLFNLRALAVKKRILFY